MALHITIEVEDMNRGNKEEEDANLKEKAKATSIGQLIY